MTEGVSIHCQDVDFYYRAELIEKFVQIKWRL